MKYTWLFLIGKANKKAHFLHKPGLRVLGQTLPTEATFRGFYGHVITFILILMKTSQLKWKCDEEKHAFNS